MTLTFNEDVIRDLANLTTMDTTPQSEFPNFLMMSLTLHVIGMAKLLKVLSKSHPFLFALDIATSLLFILQIAEKETPWQEVKPQVEDLIHEKLGDYYIEQMQSKFVSIGENLRAFKTVLRLHEDAVPENKTRLAELVRVHFVGLTGLMRTLVHELQMEEFAAPALPVFTMVANMELLLLVEGMRLAESWGFTKEYVQKFCRDEFDRKTGIKEGKAPGVWRRGVVPRSLTAPALSEPARTKGQMELLADAIEKGETAGLSPELVATWKHAYTAHTVRRRSSQAADLDYPTYARDTYEKGRGMVRLGPSNWDEELPRNQNKWQSAMLHRQYAEYDALMSMSALMFTEYWPYLTGEFEIPQLVMERMDREIYAGPIGGWNMEVPLPWSPHRPAPIRPRNGNLRAIKLRADRLIKASQIKVGHYWDTYYGNHWTGRAYQIDLDPDEYIVNITVAGSFESEWRVEDFYQPLGKSVFALRFWSNKRVYGPYGSGKCTEWKLLGRTAKDWGIHVSRPGYRLSSIHLSPTLPIYGSIEEQNRTDAGEKVWRGCIPYPCCDVSHGHLGIVFGFRPLLLAFSDHVPKNFTDVKAA